MSAATLTCGCKVNLGLRITGVREDGYHLLDSLFWPLPEPHDTLEMATRPEPDIAVRLDADFDPANNTLTKAYAAFAASVPDAPGVDLRLTKGIPMGAGLGGGSADAACLLRWLNTQVARPLDEDALAAVALKVGADCPFFLNNRPCRVQGIGEIVTPYTGPVPAGALELLLVCPDVSVSTVWAYKRHDELLREQGHGQQDGQAHSLTKPAAAASNHSSFPADALLVNDLEPAVFGRYPQLAAIKAQLLELGARAACMSGSGASILGLFAKGEAQTAQAVFAKQNMRAYAMPLEHAGM